MPSTEELLVKTSRTFALAIPLLPEPTRTTTRLAYLLFRIADTLEDAEAWPRAKRMEGLAQFAELLRSPEPEAARRVSRAWVDGAPTRHAAYLELLESVPQVLAEVADVEQGAQRIILRHALRTTEGMKKILADSDEQGRVRITNLEELRGYCYVVAGIVGELLTELFLHDAPALDPVGGVLKANERGFGEGLQLVNILKDEHVDATDGRTYLPAGVPRKDVLALAWSGLKQARHYIDALKTGGAPPGFYSFTALSQQLAEATMEVLERNGPGAKIPRTQVFAILARVQQAASSQ
jgi:farnesyl-diphosphate farnesyltransferase